jgi:hypothetical protein
VCSLLGFNEVVVVEVVGERDGRFVPLFPLISFVAADQKYRRRCGIEQKQDAQGACSEFFHVVMSAGLDGVDHRSAQSRTVLFEEVDAVFDSCSVSAIEVQKPAFEFGGANDFPSHSPSIAHDLYRANPMTI